MDDEGGEEEMEWLMEELEAPPASSSSNSASSSSSHRGKGNHGNGHIRTKAMNTDGLRSFTLDEQEDDSEDEVLSVPGVKVVKSSAAHRSAFLQVRVQGGGHVGSVLIRQPVLIIDHDQFSLTTSAL